MGKRKVLIIEDDEDVVSFLKIAIDFFLPESEISYAYTGKEALDFLAKEAFSLITLDGHLGDDAYGKDIIAKMSSEQIRNTIVYSSDQEFFDKCKYNGISAVSKSGNLGLELKAILSSKGIN